MAYPTIAPLSAAQLLRRPKGALVALRGPSSTTPATAPTHSGTPTSTLYCNAVAGVESVSDATMTLSTHVLSSGAVWLLPSWTYSVDHHQVTAATSVAIAPRYLLYRTTTIRYGPHGTR